MLSIRKIRDGLGVDLLKITGYGESEISELGSMDYREMKEIAMENLNNDSNDNRYSSDRVVNYEDIYNVWISDCALFVEVGWR